MSELIRKLFLSDFLVAVVLITFGVVLFGRGAEVAFFMLAGGVFGAAMMMRECENKRQ